MSNRKPCNRQVLDVILGAVEQHRCAAATLRARKLQQRSLAWRLWGIEYDGLIPIDAPEEPDWAIIAADIEAAEQEKQELTTFVERIAALLTTHFTHLGRQRHYADRLSPRSREIAPMDAVRSSPRRGLRGAGIKA